MNWESFKEQFDESWHSKMKPFIESEECDKIYKFLKAESKRGKKIAPLSENVFRCFKETPLDKLKVIFCGLSPYHTYRNGEPIADGLMMGCSTTKYLQPSLEQFYNEIERTYSDGLNANIIKDPDVSYYAHEGILMFNASLTVEMNKAGSHLELWEPFMKYFFEEIVGGTGVPVVFFGKEAWKLEKYVAPFTWVFKVSHPASAAYKGTDWDSNGLFKKIDKVLMDMNGYTIAWSNALPF